MDTRLEDATWACISEIRKAFPDTLERTTADDLEWLATQVLNGSIRGVPPVGHDAMFDHPVFEEAVGVAARPDLRAFGEHHFNGFTRDLLATWAPDLARIGVKTFALEFTERHIRVMRDAIASGDVRAATLGLTPQDATSYGALIVGLEECGIETVGIVATDLNWRIKGQKREDMLRDSLDEIIDAHSPGEVACFFGLDHVARSPHPWSPDEDRTYFENSFTRQLEQSGKTISVVQFTGGFDLPVNGDERPDEISPSRFCIYERGRDRVVHMPEYLRGVSTREMALARDRFTSADSIRDSVNESFVHAGKAVIAGEPGAMTYFANLASSHGSPGLAAIFFQAARDSGDRNVGPALERSVASARPEVREVMSVVSSRSSEVSEDLGTATETGWRVQLQLRRAEEMLGAARGEDDRQVATRGLDALHATVDEDDLATAISESRRAVAGDLDGIDAIENGLDAV